MELFVDVELVRLETLHHKSWHVYSAENVARVKRDEAKARGEEEETDRRLMLAESEARLDRMRKKSRKERPGEGEGEKALERQLKGLPAKEDKEEGGSMIVRPEGWTRDKGKQREADVGPHVAGTDGNRHINFWSEFEAGKSVGPNVEAKLEKALEKEKLESVTKMYLAKKGEGDPKGWYANMDGKSDLERKEGVETTLERAYKDGEQKRLTDPLAQMNAYLKRRSDVLSGASIHRSTTTGRERYRVPDTPNTERGDLSPVITSLLSKKRRRGDPIPPPSPPRAQPQPAPSSSMSSIARKDPQAEAASRVSSERARAAALIAARKKATGSSASSVASGTPRSEWGASGFGMFNREETRAAQRSWEEPRKRDSWGEQKRRREERDNRWSRGR
ncbi:hypothetical protein MNV49_002545 [Pseudohyphozyma bogoriensis]|nr:hypothetical protein MNV49_002545 [Pseudohyphozyma bogoriensis]